MPRIEQLRCDWAAPVCETTGIQYTVSYGRTEREFILCPDHLKVCTIEQALKMSRPVSGRRTGARSTRVRDHLLAIAVDE